MRALAPLLLASSLTIGASAAAAQTVVTHKGPPLTLSRLDCGTLKIKEFDSFFSDAHDFRPGPRTVTDSCYLVRSGNDILLWDTGLPSALEGKTESGKQTEASLNKTIVEQLATLGLKASDIDFVGLSHKHFDHTGQAKEFAGAKLIVGKADFEGMAGDGDPVAPWRAEGAKVELADGDDVDVFGDGKVIAFRTPGHTDGHLSLMVKLASGPILLTGDLYHSTEARQKKAVPPFNSDRADTLASMDRFEKMVRNYRAKVIVQHEPDDIDKLPKFPAAAK